MPLSRNFKKTILARVERDGKFRDALFREAIEAMLCGDIDVGKSMLRDYIHATVGFEMLADATGTPVKSLMRMFGPKGNPQAKNLFSVISYLQQEAGLHLSLRASRPS